MIEKILKLFGIIIFIDFLVLGVSILKYQKTYGLIEWLFYDEYKDAWILDLTPAPYWLSFLLGVFCIGFSFYGIYRTFVNKK